MTTRPNKGDHFTFESMVMHNLYVNPDYGVVADAPRLTAINPNQALAANLEEAPNMQEAAAALKKSGPKKGLAKSWNRPIEVGERIYRDKQDSRAMTNIQSWLMAANKKQGWEKRKDTLIRQMEEAGISDKFPVGVGGMWVRYTFSIKAFPLHYLNIDLPLTRELGTKFRFGRRGKF